MNTSLVKTDDLDAEIEQALKELPPRQRRFCQILPLERIRRVLLSRRVMPHLMPMSMPRVY